MSDVLAPAAVQFWVAGQPAPAGSKRGFQVGGRVQVVDANQANLKLWRATVSQAAQAAMGERAPFDCPLALSVRFVRKRPGGHYTGKGALSATGRRMPYPTQKPDVTKLLRAVEDALTGIVYTDDALISEQYAEKIFGDRPGALVRVQPRP
jgi:crossover junction endodeoxyribonuclease RusA